MYKNYIITKFKGKYKLYDALAIEMEDFTHNTHNNDRVVIDKYNRVYHKYEYEEVDDWYADIGAITHTEKCREYLGKVVYSSDNIEEIARKFVELSGGIK